MPKQPEPQQLDYPDIAPFQVTATRECPTPASAVFEVLADNPGGAHWLGWYVTSVVSTSTPAHGVGSTRTVNWLYGLGRLEERFVGWQEPYVWSFTLTGARPALFSKLVERIRIDPVDDEHCRIDYHLGVDFTGPGRLLARPLLVWVNREIGSTLERISQVAIRRHSH